CPCSPHPPTATEGSAGLASQPASPSGPLFLAFPIAPFSGGATRQKKKEFPTRGEEKGGTALILAKTEKAKQCRGAPKRRKPAPPKWRSGLSLRRRKAFRKRI